MDYKYNQNKNIGKLGVASPIYDNHKLGSQYPGGFFLGEGRAEIGIGPDFENDDQLFGSNRNELDPFLNERSFNNGYRDHFDHPKTNEYLGMLNYNNSDIFSYNSNDDEDYSIHEDLAKNNKTVSCLILLSYSLV